ncbi:hypothetical protein CR513_24316, partial [Mucuna pruriens]
MIENLVLAPIILARRQQPYFHSHTIVVRIDHPIRQVLWKLELARRMTTQLVEIFEFSLKFEPRGAIKSQAPADFIMKMTLYVDGSLNSKGWGASIILEGVGQVMLEHFLKLDFKTSNNQAEYEALLCNSDSQLVTEHIKGTYQVKDSLLLRYYHKVLNTLQKFDMFKVKHFPTENNTRADMLSKLATTKTILHKTTKPPTIDESEVLNEETID